MQYPKDIITEVLMSEEEINIRSKEIATKITKDYEDKNLVLVATLKGSIPFFSNIMKYVNLDCEIQFIRASSYIGNTTTTMGNVKVSNQTEFDIKDKDILIIEDIVDSGLTAKSLFEYFNNKGCKSVNICSLLDKPSRRIVDVKPKYVGKEIEDKFVIGFGLDYNEKYRNLPFVGVINKKYI